MNRRKNNKIDVDIRKTDELTPKELQKSLIAHFREDTERFLSQEEDHKDFREGLGEIKVFMQNLSWLNDISQGTQLLKKPSLWFLAFILGIVALMGGLKALLVGIASWITPR